MRAIFILNLKQFFKKDHKMSLKKFFLLFILSFFLLYFVQCQKYNYKILDGKYVINDLNEFLKVFKKALKEKDKDTILKLCVKKIIYDDENFKGHNLNNEVILDTGFDYDLCLRLINNEPEIFGDEKREQAYIPKYKRTVNEKYTVVLNKRYNNGWLFMGLSLIPYEYIPDNK